MMRKRAAALTKTKSATKNEADYDIAYEILGTHSKREVKVSRTPECYQILLSSEVTCMRRFSKFSF